METTTVQFIVLGTGGIIITVILKEIVKIVKEMSILVAVIVRLTAEVYQATHVPGFKPDFDNSKDEQLKG